MKNDLLSKGIELLKLLISSGSEAYIVGEPLRDMLIGVEITYLEIFTTQTRDGIKSLLEASLIKEVDENHLEVFWYSYRFLIYHNKSFDLNAKTSESIKKRHYSTALLSFLEKKDFKVNALAMGANDVVYDCFNGREDIKKRKINLINNNPIEIFTNNPIKILETVGLVSTLGYKLDRLILQGLQRKAKLLKKLSIYVISKQLDQILSGKYAKKGIKLLIKTRIYKRIPYFKKDLKYLSKHFYKFDKDLFLATPLVRNNTYVEAIANISNNREMFPLLVNLAITNKDCDYDVFTLYSNGLENCLKANLINYRLGRCKKRVRQITKAYNDLVIKKTCDLAFKGQDIIAITNDFNGSYLPGLVDEITAKVLLKELPNEFEALKEFAISKLSELNITDLNTNESNSSKETNSFTQQPQQPQQPQQKNEASSYNESNSFNEFNSFTQQTQQTQQTNTMNQDYNKPQSNYGDLEKRVSELELYKLKNEFNEELESKIKSNGILNNIASELYDNTYQTLRKVYASELLNTPKYRRLKDEQ